MIIYIKNNEFKYEIECLCMLFFPEEKISVICGFPEDREAGNYVYIGMEQGKVNMRVFIEGKMYEKTADIKETFEGKDEDIKLSLSSALFDILNQATGIRPSWGIITGVRPVKLFRKLINEGGEGFARDYFSDKLLVEKEKTALTEETNKYEKKILDMSRPESFSLYISIPFCPTRCSYCSFVSQSVEKSGKLMPEYTDLLIKEIKYTSETARSLGLKLETVYMGGGTPTSLCENDLKRIINEINNDFDMNICREFTVEAGRPDTLTYGKLAALKDAGVGRISINPQTFNDNVLNVIGRKHDSQRTVEAFLEAESLGFDNINMDIIAGLPSDSEEGFSNTLGKTLNLAPGGITVHTLSMKRASGLAKSSDRELARESNRIRRMLSEASERLPESGYHPYYLYRQSRMVCNAENTGWAKEGFDCMYNVYVMDETHTILSCGAGAVTKLKDPYGDRIERIFNYKFAYEYNSKFENIIERKGKVNEFYEKV